VNPYKYSSKKIALPWELIQTAPSTSSAFVVNRLATRLGRITNTHYTTGDGSSQAVRRRGPRELGQATGTTGQTLTVIYDDLFDLKHSVNRAYRNGAKWMMNDAVGRVVSKLKETTGRPIWEPAPSPPAPRTCCWAIRSRSTTTCRDGRQRQVDRCSATSRTYKIRDVKGSVIMRRFDDSAFALNGQVGFCGWMRTGGNLVDTAAVKYYANSAS
jgi:HK97 family phage major capsid protein